MREVSSRQLREDTDGILRRVAAGEDMAVTVDGRPVAVLQPIPGTGRWIPRTESLAMVGEASADPGLAAELRGLAPDSTDDLPWP